MSEHALHNEQVCEFIHKENKYHDWTVTTAFYSALHFVQFEIFPFDDGFGNIYHSFDHYYAEKIRHRMSKHEATHQLVAKHLKTCNAKYKWLMDTCRTARYNNYKILPKVADEAVENLKFIKGRIKKIDETSSQHI